MCVTVGMCVQKQLCRASLLPGLPTDTAAPAGHLAARAGPALQLTCVLSSCDCGALSLHPAVLMLLMQGCGTGSGSELSANSAARAGACWCPRKWFLPCPNDCCSQGGLGSCSPSLAQDGNTSLCFLLLTWAPPTLLSKLFLEVLEAATGKMVLLNVSKGKALFSQFSLYFLSPFWGEVCSTAW